MDNQNSISNHIACSLRQLRINAGLSVFELSRMAGIESEQQLYRYEYEIDKIGIAETVAILKVLNVDIESFFSNLDEDKTIIVCSGDIN
ncbi:MULTISPECIES: helix-turn-helix domain-containing protein [Providencia]|uniref:HTH cro/C1-type domain-containing protein n=1 Tax=Providencia rettgeri TaxID=587 RepID=A0A379FTC3_PRORE|nr:MULTISPECIES: helix-turn-helix transcriptional regulator [Providencia]EJD6376015.1 helix-turn-helix transcriptional regulator [Providencia rettgeri]EJF7710280.1 helix-turn-helix transcriptional regulator [Providencia rettgeri]ELR5118757.1 helix-turn-helix transcriptional regulator [Providencia rettgeri]MBI6201136.1 helix-turn-helix transcriptional regulator [Providencia rettgeri]MCG5282430.1 helix-turn-helix transcriptional regulator [Providencia rettgeri]